MAVGQFEYSEDGVAFGDSYLEKMREFGKIQKRIGGFRFLDLSQTDYAQVLTAGSKLDPRLMKGSKSNVSHQQN